MRVRFKGEVYYFVPMDAAGIAGGGLVCTEAQAKHCDDSVCALDAEGTLWSKGRKIGTRDDLSVVDQSPLPDVSIHGLINIELLGTKISPQWRDD